MATNKRRSEEQILENHRLALENVEAQPRIAALMTDFGYETTVIAEGKALFQQTKQTYNQNQIEDDETTEVYQIFDELRDKLRKAYNMHRRKAKVVFKKDFATKSKLNLIKRTPRIYTTWMETLEKFYTDILADTDLQTKIARLKLPLTELEATNALIIDVKAARTIYVREDGESQNATKLKNQALDDLDEWMSEFYEVAAIALEEEPQLLESIARFRKS